ncbi:MAG: transposase, partial [Vicinamibacterales bacterium]
ISREFMKLHAMVGTKTNVVTACHVSDGHTNDSPLLPDLLNATAANFTVREVSADKGYSSHENIGTIVGFGAAPLVAFKSNAVGYSKSPLWNRAFHYFEMNRDEFLARYHRRSNAESTFSAMKRKFGDSLRSKTRVARVNELLLKVLCHNIVAVIHEIHESGALPVFPALAAQTCPRKLRPAQQSLLQD